MPCVFVPNRSGQDISAAEEFGDLVVLTEGTQPRLNIHRHHRVISNLMKDCKANDYILVVGPASLVAIAASIIAHRFGKVNYLIYAGGSYRERTIILEYSDEKYQPIS